MATAVTETSQPSAAAKPLAPDGQSVMLRGITWEQYLTLRDDPDNDGVRMYYADGGLLLMTTGRLHERITRLLGILIHDWTMEREIHVMSCGSWTLQRKLKKKGLEVDNCYYVSHLPDVEGKDDLDFERGDPAPDLAIEIDITTHSEHKFGIYAALGVEEVWVWRDDHFVVHRMSGDGTYARVDGSQELSGFPLDVAARLLISHYARNDIAAVKAFREATAEQE